MLLAGWWFDRSRRREGRSQYEVRGNKQQMVDVPVAGEMVEKPPERRVDHSSALAADREDQDLGDQGDQGDQGVREDREDQGD